MAMKGKGSVAGKVGGWQGTGMPQVCESTARTSELFLPKSHSRKILVQ